MTLAKIKNSKLALVMSHTFAVCRKCLRVNRVDVKSQREPVCGACQSLLPVHGAVVEISDATFPYLRNKSPIGIVVDVWAPWCGPCRAFAPTFEQMSQKFAGKIVFAKLNSDENPQTASQLGIRGIPTILFFKNSEETNRVSGALPPEQFESWLQQNL